MPVQGRIKTPLTVEEILKRVSEYDIYRYYIGHDFSLDRAFNSPLRSDENPSFSVKVGNNNKLHHLDYGNDTYSGGCIDFVCQIFSCTIPQALLRIDHDLNIGLSSPNGEIKSLQRISLGPILEVPQKKKILVVSRKFNADELKYWVSYHISKANLEENEVYAIKELYIDNRRFSLRNDICFGYKFMVEGEVKWKIYWPYRRKMEKWIGNVPNSFLSGMDKITTEDKTIIVTKAKKDELVLKLFLPRVVSVQSEGIHSINNENLNKLMKIPNRWINFDADETGLRASKYFNQFGFGWINCPNTFKDPKGNTIKDFSDLARYYGLEIVEAYFKRKRILL